MIDGGLRKEFLSPFPIPLSAAGNRTLEVHSVHSIHSLFTSLAQTVDLVPLLRPFHLHLEDKSCNVKDYKPIIQFL